MAQYGGSFGPLFIWTQADYDAIVSQLMRIVTHQQQTNVLLSRLLNQEKNVMSALDDLTAQVTANTSAEQSAVTLIQGLAAQIAAAVNTEDSAALESLAQQLNTSATALAAAVTANTPAAPTP
jgi:hypothetical protein